jgi:Tol biopolymer transport system component
MLAKRPEERPTAQQTAERLAAIARQSAANHSLFGIKAGWWALAAVMAVAAALLMLPRPPRGRLDLSRMNVHPMASQAGLDTAPSISPDGLWISSLYRTRPSDRPQFQVHATQGSTPVVIDTGGLTLADPAAWSPDSRELVFVGASSGKRSIYRTSRTGGPISAVAECNNSVRSCGIDWSPDGRSLAVSDVLPGQSSAGLFLVDIPSGRRHALIPPGGASVSKPRFSPDGRWIAFSRPASFTYDEICLIPAIGGAVRCVTRGLWWLAGFAWNSDGRSLIAISAHQADKPEMWQFSFDGKSEPYRMASFDIGRAQEPSVARRKGSLVWVRDLSSSSIWRMPVGEPGRAAELLVSSSGSDADAEWSSDGRMVFRSDRSGSSELWIARADGSGQRQATRFQGPFVGDPHWSPNGRYLAFTAHPDRNADIFTIGCDGADPQPCGSPRQLTRSPGTDANPTWSADGRWIYFSSNRSGRFEVWKIAAAGGEPARVTWNGGYVARESADGSWLYYSKVEPAKGFWRIPLPARGAGEQEESVIPHAPFRAAATWALGRRELYYYPSEQDGVLPFPSVRAVDLETRRVRDLQTGNTLLGRGLSLSADGKWLLRTQSDRSQSLIMIAE